MRSMSLRQSQAVARFFLTRDKLQGFSSIQWWLVVNHKPQASKAWRLGNPVSTTCQVRHCTTQSTALVLQLHKVAAGRDSKLPLRSRMFKPKSILSNRSYVIQHNQVQANRICLHLQPMLFIGSFGICRIQELPTTWSWRPGANL